VEEFQSFISSLHQLTVTITIVTIVTKVIVTNTVTLKATVNEQFSLKLSDS